MACDCTNTAAAAAPTTTTVTVLIRVGGPKSLISKRKIMPASLGLNYMLVRSLHEDVERPRSDGEHVHNLAHTTTMRDLSLHSVTACWPHSTGELLHVVLRLATMLRAVTACWTHSDDELLHVVLRLATVHELRLPLVTACWTNTRVHQRVRSMNDLV